MELKEDNSNFLKTVETVIFDCDGVLWDEYGQAFPGAVETLKTIRSMGKKVLFLTNNSSKTRKQYTERCNHLGFDAAEAEVVCTSWLAAAYLSDVLNYNGKTYLLGGAGLEAEFTARGLQYIGPGEDPYCASDGYNGYLNLELDPDVNAVVVGYDPYLNYTKVTKAISYLQREGCHYVCTNMDSFLPSSGPIRIPGTGSAVSFVSYAAERVPTCVGKPEVVARDIMQSTLHLTLEPGKTLMVGDRLDTDIKFGKQCKFHTLLVLTGASSCDDMMRMMSSNSVEHQKCVPEYYTKSVADLHTYLTGS